jgi:hypothetical protein
MQSQSRTLDMAAREYIWLWDHRHGMSPEQIARAFGTSPRRVRLGLTRAAAGEHGVSQTTPTDGTAPVVREPRLIPMFPITSFWPGSQCGHYRMIPMGSLFCCMVCHRSGIEGHPALQRDPREDPEPEPKPTAPPRKKPAVLTRKQKRAILYGAPGAVTSAAAPPPEPAAASAPALQ